jgi:hypothetical protein
VDYYPDQTRPTSGLIRFTTAGSSAGSASVSAPSGLATAVVPAESLNRDAPGPPAGRLSSLLSGEIPVTGKADHNDRTDKTGLPGLGTEAAAMLGDCPRLGFPAR